MCSGQVCAALWVFLVLKYLCLVFMVLLPGLLIPVPATPALSCSAIPPLAGCPGPQRSAICRGSSSASHFCFPVVQTCGPLSTNALRRHLPACLGRLGAGLSFPQCHTVSLSTPYLICPRLVLCSWPPAFSVRRPGFYSCPLPQPLLCSLPGLEALQGWTGCSAPPVLMPAKAMRGAMH